MESLREINKDSWEYRQKGFKKRYKFENRFKISYNRLLYHKPQFWLDIGTGTGQLANELHNQKPDAFVIGIDISRSMVNYSKNRKI